MLTFGLAACSAQSSGTGTQSAGESTSSKASKAPPQPVSTPPSPSADSAEEEALSAEASKRAASAPSGDPVTPPEFSGVPSGQEDFGPAILKDGDVTVYRPTRHGESLTIPVKVTNTGSRRAFYDVAIRVTGPDGFSATIRLKEDVVGLYPGTSWPTEQVVQDPGHPAPEHPQVEFEKNSKRERQS
ncbi:hypothetical protein ACIQNU_37930 [Streptomyces sp. NPDC091292]|uniref:hypothetical protein n=1 Tax=Streptomyces sp. NPDC091292 TaxID=3365991 RepID=UPI0038049312